MTDKIYCKYCKDTGIKQSLIGGIEYINCLVMGKAPRFCAYCKRGEWAHDQWINQDEQQSIKNKTRAKREV